MKNITIPNEGYFPDLDHIYVWNTDRKGNLVKVKDKYLMPAKNVDYSLQNIIRSIRWHTCSIENSKKGEFLEKCVMTVKSGPWTKQQLNMARDIVSKHGLHIVMVPKDWINGARGHTQGIGKLFLSKEPLAANIMKDYNIPAKKKLAYINLVIGENVKFKTPDDRELKARIIQGSGNGRAYMTSEINKLNGFNGVCKLGGCTKDITLVNDKLCKEYDADIVVFDDGNKLHVNENIFSGMLGHKPSCHPLVKFNKNEPVFRWGLLAAQESTINPDLFDEKVIVETGVMSYDQVFEKAGYPSEEGTKIRMSLRPLTIGMNVFTSPLTMKSLSTAIKNKIFARTFGITGTLCHISEISNDIEEIAGVGLRPPNQRPVKCIVKIDHERGLIGTTTDVINDVGGDLDGDLFMFIEKCNTWDMWKIDPEKHPMVYPEKKEAEDDKEVDIFEIWSDMVDSVARVGRVHNDSVVMLTTAMYYGASEEEKISLINDIIFYDETYIHAFKHGSNNHIPGLKERIMKKYDEKMLAKCDREKLFSNVMRRGNILDWIDTANILEAKHDAPFFEHLCSMFRNWKPNKKQKYEHLMEEVDPIRKKTYVNLINYAKRTGYFNKVHLEIRWRDVKKLLKLKYHKLSEESVKIFMLQCYKKKDWQIANYIWEKWDEWKKKEVSDAKKETK